MTTSVRYFHIFNGIIMKKEKIFVLWTNFAIGNKKKKKSRREKNKFESDGQ